MATSQSHGHSGEHRTKVAVARRRREPPARRIGPGLRAALALMGQAGVQIVHHWADLDARGAASVDQVAEHLRLPGADRFDESHPGTRWRAYRRTGLACALLRQAGRPVSSACRTAQQKH